MFWLGSSLSRVQVPERVSPHYWTEMTIGRYWERRLVGLMPLVGTAAAAAAALLAALVPRCNTFAPLPNVNTPQHNATQHTTPDTE